MQSTHPSQEILDRRSSFNPPPPSVWQGDRWFTRSARERKGRRVFENKFLNWLVGDRLNICKKMETENWCRNCKFSGDNSSTKEGSSPSSPLERDLPPRSCSWITTSAVPARLLPSPVSSLRANPGMDVSQDFLPVKCSFSVVFLPVKSYRFVCALPFPTTLRRFSGGILDA